MLDAAFLYKNLLYASFLLAYFLIYTLGLLPTSLTADVFCNEYSTLNGNFFANGDVFVKFFYLLRCSMTGRVADGLLVTGEDCWLWETYVMWIW